MTTEIATGTQVFPVEPGRLEYGHWDHQQEKQIGEGDISAAYSADLIGLQGRVRNPFRFSGSLWVTTGKSWHPIHGTAAEGWRIVPPAHFSGEITTYGEKSRLNGGDEARRDPLGFYHGMTVRYGGQTFILTGPAALFIPGTPAPQQLGLF